jgi:DNA-binding transcriptional ArsR family regulator
MGRRANTTPDRVAAAMRVAGVPERLAILEAIARRSPLSPSGYVDESDGATTLREAAYHFRYLRDAGVVTLEEVRTTGGTAQHFYGLSAIGRALVKALPALRRAAAEDGGGAG